MVGIVGMDAHSKSLNIRFWPRRETLSRPALWSSDDLRIFGCQFREVNVSQLHSPVTGPVVDDDDDERPEAWELLRSWSSDHKERYIRTILARGGLYRKLSSSTSFRIGKRIIHSSPCVLLRPVKQHSAGSDLPLTGYLDYALVNCERRQANRCRPKPGLPRDGYDAGYTERLRRIAPKEWFADPYVLCVLLSLAQHQYYDKRARRKSAYRACLLLTKTAFRRDVYLFEATISTALLDQLDDPRICLKQAPPPILINRTLINVEPTRDFGARVVAALASYGSAHEGGDSKDDDDSRDSGNSSSSETQRGI